MRQKNSPVMSDEQLFEEFCLSGNQVTFNLLIRAYAQKALMVARKYLSDDMAAQDAVQEAFIRISKRRSSYICGSPFAPWFFRILRNTCLDQLRRRRSYTDAIMRFHNDVSHHASSSEDGEDCGMMDLLLRLPVKERRVLELRVQGQLTFEEISSALGCSVEASKKRAQRGLRKLRIMAEKNMRLNEDVNHPRTEPMLVR
ncbi:MAG: RNA polymerase sigma factor [Chitinivibrionales bacterium]